VIVLYNTATSPNGQKVRLLLAETGLAHREVRVRRDLHENRSADYLAISPAGTLPAIVDEDTGARVFESGAILFYLAEKAGRFLPAEQPARADAVKWLVFETANVGPACENIYQLMYSANDETAAIEFQQGKLRRAVALLDEQLARGAYLAGECSIADFALLPWMLMLEDFAGADPAEFPNVARWIGRMRARPAIAALLGA